MRCAFGECGLAGQEAAVAGVGDGRRREGDEARDDGGKGGPAHAGWHRIERGSDGVRSTCPPRSGDSVRGVRERRPAAARASTSTRSGGALVFQRAARRARGGSASGAGCRSSSASRAPTARTTPSTSSTRRRRVAATVADAWRRRLTAIRSAVVASVDVRARRLGLLQAAVSLAAWRDRLVGDAPAGTAHPARRAALARPRRGARALRGRDRAARRALASDPRRAGPRPRTRRELPADARRLHGEQHAARARGRPDARDAARRRRGGPCSARSSPSACSTSPRSAPIFAFVVLERGLDVRAAAVPRRRGRARAGRRGGALALRAARRASGRARSSAATPPSCCRVHGAALARCCRVALWLVEASVYLVVGYAVGVHLGVDRRALRDGADEPLGARPGCPGYVGTYDAAVLLALRSLQLPALGYLLVLRFVLFVPITVAGFAVFLAPLRAEAPVMSALSGASAALALAGPCGAGAARALVCLSLYLRTRAARHAASGSTRASRSGSRTTTGRRSRTCCARTARRPLYYMLLGALDPRSSATASARRTRSRSSSALACIPLAYVLGRSVFDRATGSSPPCSPRSTRSSPTTRRRRGCTSSRRSSRSSSRSRT